MSDDNVIKLKETTHEFRKGCMSAMKCVQDMGKGAHTYDSLLSVIDSILILHNKGNFFPQPDCCHEWHSEQEPLPVASTDYQVHITNNIIKCKKCGEFYL